MSQLPPCPDSLRQIQHYLKIAAEHEERDPVVCYWCRLHALQVGLGISPAKTPQEKALLTAIMDWLEKFKKIHLENEAITNEVAAQAHLENYALKLFLYADQQDRAANFGKNVVKAFYTSGIIYDTLASFGELSDECAQNRKYAKWKAAYIHNCLKNGETPVPGPMTNEDDEDNEAPPANNENSENVNDPPPPSINITPANPTPPSNIGFLPPTQPLAPPPASVFPSVPQTPEPNPGGFQAFIPPPQPVVPQVSHDNLPSLTPEQMIKAQKYCKWAGSALTFDDIKTAVTNLTYALTLLQTGHDPA